MKILILTLFFILTAQMVSANCGIMPIKPITPIGCKGLVAVCICDSFGQNCYWTWQCVR